MKKLIDIKSYPVGPVIGRLLQDKTTKLNIIWATDTYQDYGVGFLDKDHITKERILGVDSVILQPRISKAIEEQQIRTRKKAEVFTPVWLCNKMNNYCDEQWFGRPNVFNIECSENTWDVVDAKIEFPAEKNWKQYIDSRRLEITCGEAPYLVSRYDAATGDLILPPFRRIGILDRKLRIVNENTETENDWIKWTVRAFQSCYGYEYQGDSLLIARINLLMTFYDYYVERWHKDPIDSLIRKIANIISWNIWQMDGLKDTVPLGKPFEEDVQMSIFDFIDNNEIKEQEPEQMELDFALPCKIMDWRAENSVIFKILKENNR